MKPNVLREGEGYLSRQSLNIPLKAEFGSARAAHSIWARGSALQIRPAVQGAIPWTVFAAYAAALASTGFLLVMALTGGIHLG